ncbi:MAG TPA: DUF1501 domain-containing protein [Gemmataceae bacterium]|nr:DUF1501 domain-containing protein [Gemmataceae bacterium]
MPESSNFTPPRIARRQFLGRNALTAGTLAVGDFLRLRAEAPGPRPARAESCILVFLNGGMSHLDTFDPKPNQPPEIRGEFATARTTAPGVLVTEHLPRLARQAHRFTVVRSVGFDGRLGNHSPACFHMLTGREPQGEDAVLAPPRPTDHPTMGAVAARMRPAPPTVPAFVMVPDVLIENAHLTPGQFAGWLGGRYESFRLQGDPSSPAFSVPALALPADVPDARLADRQELLARLDAGRGDLERTAAGRERDAYHERAFDLLAGTRAQAAFDLAAEPPRTRDRYGRDKFGQSVLLARRAVEAGVRFVNVHWPNVGGGANWDTHSNGFQRLKNTLLPPADRAIAALLDDLADRGLLGQTLVLVLTEFGRAPQIGRTFQNSGGPGGRDHWSNCFSVLVAGGVPGGRVYGSSDAKGSYPADRPVTPADLTATVYQALGIDPSTVLRDAEGRTHRLCDGKPIDGLL